MSAMLRSRPVLKRFVTCALTRSTLPRRLFPSELLRWSSSASAIPTPSFTHQPPPHHVSPPAPATDAPADEKDPALAFHTLAERIHPHTLKAITVRPFKHTHMSPVQAHILPMLPTLALPHTEHPATTDTSAASAHPRDLLVKAKTGTGKTMAFLVPAIEARVKALAAHTAALATKRTGVALDRAARAAAEQTFARRHVGCLIISPTRELASQIAAEASNLTAHHPGWQTQVLLGGESKTRQLRDWRGRKDIVVATPGRILDLLASAPGFADDIATCNLLILDEADTLLDMGFRDDITRLLTYLPPQPQRQTFLFSATVSRAIQQIAQASLAPNHKYINCVAQDDSPVHAHIPQYHTVLRSGADVLPHVLRLIANDQLAYPGAGASRSSSTPSSPAPGTGKLTSSKIVVFLSTTNMVTLFSALLRKALPLLPLPPSQTALFEIHSKRDMKARQRVSQQFRTSRAACSILVTSDVSARGVDYPGVTRVIQIGCPSGRDVYVHRVGRTGRGASKEGRGDLVLMPWEMGFVSGKLADVGLKPVTQEQTLSELQERASSSSSSSASSSNTTHKFDRARIEELSTSAPLLATQMQSTHLDDIRTAFSSQAGFFLGRAGEQGLALRSVLAGLTEMWQEMWGLDRAPYLSRGLEEMVRGALAGQAVRYGKGAGARGGGGGGYGGSSGGYAGRSASRGGYANDRYQGSGDRHQRPTSYEDSSDANPTSHSITGHFSSTGGYGFPRGARQGKAYSYAGRYAGGREAGWESGGEGYARASRGDAGAGARSGGYGDARSGGYGRREPEVDGYESDSSSSSSYGRRASASSTGSGSGSYDYRSRGSKSSALRGGARSGGDRGGDRGGRSGGDSEREREPARGGDEYVSGRGRTHGRAAAFSAGVRARRDGFE